MEYRFLHREVGFYSFKEEKVPMNVVFSVDAKEPICFIDFYEEITVPIRWEVAPELFTSLLGKSVYENDRIFFKKNKNENVFELNVKGYLVPNVFKVEFFSKKILNIAQEIDNLGLEHEFGFLNDEDIFEFLGNS